MLVIEKEMEKAKAITENAINEHWLAFLSQMRDKIGVENITLKQEYLKYSISKNALHYLKRLENLQFALRDAESGGESGGNVTMRLNGERNHHIISVKQDMDANRQQEFGMKKYIWRTAGDDRVRPAHAANEGKVFAWDEGEKPGESYNCRCSAEPFPEYHGADDPPIQPVYPLETLIVLWGGLGVAKKIGKDILEWFNDSDKKPTEKPVEQPKPESEVQKPTQGKEPPAGGRENTNWQFGRHKSETKWNNQIRERGWTKEKITDTIKNGKEYPAPNKIREKIDPKATATRYEKDGKFVVRDDQTGDILQISDEKFIPQDLP